MTAGMPDLHELSRLGFDEIMILETGLNRAVSAVSIENRWLAAHLFERMRSLQLEMPILQKLR